MAIELKEESYRALWADRTPEAAEDIIKLSGLQP